MLDPSTLLPRAADRLSALDSMNSLSGDLARSRCPLPRNALFTFFLVITEILEPRLANHSFGIFGTHDPNYHTR